MTAVSARAILLFNPLAPFRPVEDDPGFETVAEIKKSMLQARGHEQEITGFKRDDVAAHLKLAGAVGNDITLIPAVWLLKIFILRDIEFNFQFTP